MQKTKDPLRRAIEKAGSQNKLAKAIGCSQQLVAYWLRSESKGAAPEYCIPIETETGVSRHELRPDVFGPANADAAA